MAEKVEEVAWLVIELATKAGGMHMAPSARASGSGFMGTGKRVNEVEAGFMADLKANLRI